ncbi:HumD protein [Sodalis praecaptivus]|uniref:HumD protein n=1 Tax=Sodalis praecaptivus TaxID=1239307 RepID=W0I0A4_9GAMM|nr:S24 family peptidase [Sodalis praecaptivus]AHF77878.1 HumD protein [Sodalis praecaptivus]
MGFPSPAADYVEASLSLDKMCIHRPAATFLMRASEGSIRHGIHQGSIIVVDRSLTPVDGSIVVAEVGGEYALRRYKLYPSRGLERLDYPGRLEGVEEHDGVVGFGVVTYVLNDMRTGEFDDDPCI